MEHEPEALPVSPREIRGTVTIDAPPEGMGVVSPALQGILESGRSYGTVTSDIPPAGRGEMNPALQGLRNDTEIAASVVQQTVENKENPENCKTAPLEVHKACPLFGVCFPGADKELDEKGEFFDPTKTVSGEIKREEVVHMRKKYTKAIPVDQLPEQTKRILTDAIVQARAAKEVPPEMSDQLAVEPVTVVEQVQSVVTAAPVVVETPVAERANGVVEQTDAAIQVHENMSDTPRQRTAVSEATVVENVKEPVAEVTAVVYEPARAVRADMPPEIRVSELVVTQSHEKRRVVHDVIEHEERIAESPRAQQEKQADQAPIVMPQSVDVVSTAPQEQRVPAAAEAVVPAPVALPEQHGAQTPDAARPTEGSAAVEQPETPRSATNLQTEQLVVEVAEQSAPDVVSEARDVAASVYDVEQAHAVAPAVEVVDHEGVNREVVNDVHEPQETVTYEFVSAQQIKPVSEMVIAEDGDHPVEAVTEAVDVMQSENIHLEQTAPEGDVDIQYESVIDTPRMVHESDGFVPDEEQSLVFSAIHEEVAVNENAGAADAVLPDEFDTPITVVAETISEQAAEEQIETPSIEVFDQLPEIADAFITSLQDEQVAVQGSVASDAEGLPGCTDEVQVVVSEGVESHTIGDEAVTIADADSKADKIIDLSDVPDEQAAHVISLLTALEEYDTGMSQGVSGESVIQFIVKTREGERALVFDVALWEQFLVYLQEQHAEIAEMMRQMVASPEIVMQPKEVKHGVFHYVDPVLSDGAIVSFLSIVFHLIFI